MISSLRTKSSLIPLRKCHFKKFDTPIQQAYQSDEVEKGWDEYWESAGLYAPKEELKDKFSILLPPPNVTGHLHLGHTLTSTLQDILMRWNRMRGRACLWLPGTDHAGIATQVVVEKKLMKTQQATRHSLGREQFLEHVWAWKEEHGGQITQQLRRTGASLDWSREYFTMDAQRELAVQVAFVRLFEAGLIYRATRLVHWCPVLQSVISDIEVDRVAVEANTVLRIPRRQDGNGDGQKKDDVSVEVGVIHVIKYPLAPLSGTGPSTEHLVVWTTRPETILGDTGLAVHPDDARYSQYAGRQAINPLTGRAIPIVTDRMVDIELGSGVVKVTPAHDFNDYECGRRHNLEQRVIFDTQARVTCPELPQFDRLDRFEAREAVVTALKDLGLYLEKKAHPMSILLCSRSGDIVEPLLLPQWFMNCKTLASEAVTLVRDGTIEMFPQTAKADWYRWLEDDQRDWCISRQLWWGHRIPAYQVQSKTRGDLGWIAEISPERALEAAKSKFGIADASDVTVRQDEDVLDTWFSSGLLPLSSLNWPWDAANPGSHSADEPLQWSHQHYPFSVMETGTDILFFWVARMVMLCYYFTKQAPFNKIYLHPLVRDSNGKKMSKSLGNVIDPLQVIDGVSLDVLLRNLREGNMSTAEVDRASNVIKKEFPEGIPMCGADSLRFTLAWYTQQGRSINLDVNAIIANKHFCNKIWQATKFCLSTIEQFSHPLPGDNDIVTVRSFFAGANFLALGRPKTLVNFSILDLGILRELQFATREVNSHLEQMDFGAASISIHTFFWNQFCDKYIEWAKIQFKLALNLADSAKEKIPRLRTIVAILLTCLSQSLRLLHPFMPFITEELTVRVHQYRQRRLRQEAEANGATVTETPYTSILNQPYPSVTAWTYSFLKLKEDDPRDLNAVVEKIPNIFNELLMAVRSLRKSLNLQSRDRAACSVYWSDNDASSQAFFAQDLELQHVLTTLTALDSLEIVNGPQPQEIPASSGLRIVNENISLLITPIVQEKALDIEKELGKFYRKKTETEKSLENLNSQLNGENYLKNTPKPIQEKHRTLKSTLEKSLSDVCQELARLELLKKSKKTTIE